MRAAGPAIGPIHLFVLKPNRQRPFETLSGRLFLSSVGTEIRIIREICG
jgi:hypothetical protein